jgi:hypothetical protein
MSSGGAGWRQRWSDSSGAARMLLRGRASHTPIPTPRPCTHTRRFQECLWGSERKVADVDTQGLEDPKLFVWPGKGVYAVFGRKPEALGSSPYCRNPIFVQFLVQVRGAGRGGGVRGFVSGQGRGSRGQQRAAGAAGRQPRGVSGWQAAAAAATGAAGPRHPCPHSPPPGRRGGRQRRVVHPPPPRAQARLLRPRAVPRRAAGAAHQGEELDALRARGAPLHDAQRRAPPRVQVRGRRRLRQWSPGPRRLQGLMQLGHPPLPLTSKPAAHTSTPALPPPQPPLPRMNSQGVAVQQFLSTNERLFAPFVGQDVHGGPPVVRIDGPLLAAGAAPYYLGIFHFFMVRGGGVQGAWAGAAGSVKEGLGPSAASRPGPPPRRPPPPFTTHLRPPPHPNPQRPLARAPTR